MPQIIEHCPNLVNLNLRGVTATKSEKADLLDAQRTGPLRTCLLTLNLNSSNFFDGKFCSNL
ncbi:hypothetical protein P3T76_007448 [Phytophthora citrophthora]|uniref:Uncharacterized protein n=1 Tax=Phytophthora citrophthora TaxID=4793 RepID=A0AAD9GN12_9STRA|nr:hypothetical protein P3T76_007448 [Phytophthora citrophthora]